MALNVKVVRILPSWWPFTAVALFPLILLKRNYVPREPFTTWLIWHECIHLFQQRELLIVGAYVEYLLEYLVRLIVYRSRHYAYYTLSMEVEAYQNQDVDGYLIDRPRYAWAKHLFKRNVYNLPLRKIDFDKRRLPPLYFEIDYEGNKAGDVYDPYSATHEEMAKLYARNIITRKYSPAA